MKKRSFIGAMKDEKRPKIEEKVVHPSYEGPKEGENRRKGLSSEL
ncbi:hypothetical protein [Metabacillus sediminilitoris]|nr:hypothetical protein [Metabacillus sediminilitoris]